MQRHHRAIAQAILAIAMAATVAAALPPAHTVAGTRKVGITLAILLGTLAIPAGLTIGAARDSQP